MVQLKSHSAHVLEAKQAKLDGLLRGFGSACIGYSGGVDSAFLAVAALDALGPRRVLAVTGLSPAYPRVQREQALACVRRFGIPHLELDTDELNDANYAANPPNRCYYCKAELWTRLAALARRRGLAVVCDGANADDASDHRPGARAAAERSVRSPLLDAGLSKAEIRVLARRRGLPVWDAPAAPCLASRLQYGVGVTAERLRAIEKAEDALRALGFREFRVRHHGDVARVETSPEELPRAWRCARPLTEACRSAGFERVLIDVEGYRRGALSSTLPLVRLEPCADARPSAAEPPLVRATVLLRAAGIDAPAGTAGSAGDILVVDAPLEQAARVAALAADLKRAGFRFVALESAPQCAA